LGGITKILALLILKGGWVFCLSLGEESEKDSWLLYFRSQGGREGDLGLRLFDKWERCQNPKKCCRRNANPKSWSGIREQISHDPKKEKF